MNCLAADEMTRSCSNDGGGTRVSQDIGCRFLDMGIFGVFYCICYNQISAFQAIAQIAELDGDATGGGWLAVEYKFLTIIFKSLVSALTRKRAYRTETTEGGHDEIRPVYPEDIADRHMSPSFHECDWQSYRKKDDDYMEHSRLDGRDRYTSYRSSPVTSEGGDENLPSSTDQYTDNFSKGIDDDADSHFDGAIGWKVVQCAGVKSKS